MRPTMGALCLFSLGALITASTLPVLAAPHQERRIQFGENSGAFSHLRRSVSGDGGNISGQTYDYIVVGGGLAGLTVANRLSEDTDVTVAVIEAGADIYGPDQQKFLNPIANLYDSAVDTQYDWQWTTTNQAGLNGRSVPWPRGKVLGGSSSVNGLYMVRASKREHDAWASMIGSPELWGWDNMLRAMQKSERFSPPSQNVRDTVPSLQWDASSHGTDGPIHVGWPAVSYPAVEAFLQSSANEGTAISADPNGGDSWGSFLATSCIDQTNWERSSSRTGYLNEADRRPNLHVLTGHQVTKVLFDTSDASAVRATGVEYAAYSGANVNQVYAGREVILSGGAINSPAILQTSGVGDASQLRNLGIESVVDLPGVGHNVKDHLSASVIFTPASNQQLPEFRVTGNPEADSYVNSAIAYVNISTLFGDYAQTLIDNVRSNLTNVINSAPVSGAVKQAYNVTYTAQVEDVFNTQVGPIELLFAMGFNSLMVQVALQHPLSRGSILINSANAFDSPRIDAGYLTQDFDLQLLREGFKLARKVGNAAPLSSHVTGEVVPGTGISTDDQWDQWIRDNVGTEYHPSSSCSMLPRESGGVVDANLLVYGTQNLRVIDASVPPTAVSAHLMTITYGIGEIGAEIVKSARQQALQANDSTSSGGSPSGTPSDSNSNSNSSGAGTGSGASTSSAMTTTLSLSATMLSTLIVLLAVAVW